MSSSFGVIDYVIFGAMFAVSSTVGVLFAYRDRNNKSTDNYYFGERSIGAIPVAISIAVSYISAITLIGMPSEVYSYGIVVSWFIPAVLSANLIAVVYYVPVFHKLRLSSLYEYLELRFNKRLRQIASTMGIMYMGLFLGVALYVPSLALSAVTPLSLNWTIALISVTCTFYTSLGGIKAVIWADVLQSVAMVIGMLAVLVRGCLAVGGFDSIISAAERGGRNNFLTFDFDPRIRSTFMTVFVGYVVITSFDVICNQMLIQRWLSCKTIRESKIAVGLSAFLLAFLTAISLVNGLVLYAFYEGCDPLLSGRITKMDQILPALAVDLFQNVPGMAGLFVSAAFCAALSTVSSGINSLSALALIDFVLPQFPKLTPPTQVMLSKLFTVLFGGIEMSLAYIISLSSTNAIEVAAAITGLTGGPILSVFVMGTMMPWINYKGALTGLVVGFGITAWVSLSALIHSTNSGIRLPISMENCNETTMSTDILNVTHAPTTIMTSFTPSTDIMEDESLTIYNTIYAISPFLHGLLGLLTSILVAHVSSLIFGFSKPSEANSALFVPLIDNKLLPEKVRKIFRFGVPEQTCDDHNSTERERIILAKM